MIGALGAEIDRLEYEIQQAVPGIRHIDLVSLAAQTAVEEKGDDSFTAILAQ